jgi:hypothetical protein
MVRAISSQLVKPESVDGLESHLICLKRFIRQSDGIGIGK